jgi:hypothetical protein
MIGEFKAGSVSYLLLFNKDRNNPHDVSLTFKKAVPVWACDNSAGTWSRRSPSASSIIIPALQPADLRILRLSD